MCAKQVPDPAAPVRVDPATHRIDRSGRLVLDDADAVGIEVGLSLGGPVTLVSMAPRDEVTGLRQGLALGATGAVLVSDAALAGADSLVTAKVLAAAVGRLGPVDVIVAGTDSVDGYTGLMPSQLAELLGLPAVTFARRVSVPDGGGVLRAERVTATGHEDVECPLPCVLTVTSSAAVPRYPTYRDIVGARAKPVEVLRLADLGLSGSAVAASQEVVAIEAVERRRAAVVVDDGDGRGHEAVLELLARAGVV